MEWKPKWVKLPILDFFRKVHSFDGQPPEKMSEWLTEFTNALMFGNNESGCELANQMINESIEFTRRKAEAGRIGGLASAASRSGWREFSDEIPQPKSKKEVLDFAADNGLDIDDARTWWERNFVERPGCDRYGEVFKNWKGALVNACRAESKKRQGEVK